MSEAEAQVMAPEPETDELPPPHIQDMIQHAMENEFTKANNIFDDLMTVKLNDVLDQEQIRMADQIYNGVEDEEEIDPDDEQLEFDLEGEGELESEEQDDEEDDEVEDNIDEDDDDEGLELEDEEEENSSE
jgi:hypothetical protein